MFEDIRIEAKSENINASMQEKASYILSDKIIKSTILENVEPGHSESWGESSSDVSLDMM
jgi:hypothetical protein